VLTLFCVALVRLLVLLLIHAHRTTPRTRAAPQRPQRQQPSSPLLCTRILKHAMTFDPPSHSSPSGAMTFDLGVTIPLLFVGTRTRRSSTLNDSARASQSHSSASELRHDDLDPGAHHSTHQVPAACLHRPSPPLAALIPPFFLQLVSCCP
jgi:hypothetical protein